MMRASIETGGFMEIVDLEDLVPQTHPYRKFLKAIDFRPCFDALKDLSNEGKVGATGFRPEQLFKALLLQFMGDNSDREHDRFLQENNAAKWFCQ